MKNVDFLIDAIGLIDDDLIIAADVPVRRKRNVGLKRTAIIAACVALLAVLTVVLAVAYPDNTPPPPPERIEICEPYSTVIDSHFPGNVMVKNDYNSYGLPTRTSFISFACNGLLTMYMDHVYDDRGLLTESICYVAPTEQDLYTGTYKRSMTLKWTLDGNYKPIHAKTVSFGVRSALCAFDGAVEFQVIYHDSGKIKNILCTNTDTGKLLYYATYNELGQLTVDGDETLEIAYTYAEGATLPCEETHYYKDASDGTKTPKMSYTVEYENGYFKARQAKATQSSENAKLTVEYTESGDAVAKCTWDSFYSISTSEFYYDGEGHLFEHVDFSRIYGNLEGTTTTIQIWRDEARNVADLASTTVTGNTQSMYTVRYNYLWDGRVRTVKNNYSSGRVGSDLAVFTTLDSILEYNSDGQLIHEESRMFLPGVPEMNPYKDIIEYEYDSYGRLVKTTDYRYNENDKLTLYHTDEITYKTATGLAKDTTVRTTYRPNGEITDTSTKKH